ncbi:uncharacterized protein LOC132628735 [Lycium barbarum]|uniref:uncharacterized protein LOC132628735 n=1 Tax=Lycium barbarum TaxID=112863 RepID=UPI00293EB69D|nr:uncharacterized protein LOC132628735 [Lycium barbarum]
MEEESLGEDLTVVQVNFDADEMEGYVETINTLEGLGSYTYHLRNLDLDLANRTTPPAKPSILEEDRKSSVEQQRRLNHNMQEVVKKEFINFLDVEVVYLIAGSKWHICMDYRKLNTTTCKDHFSMPFIDQILHRLAGRMSIFSDMVDDILEVFMDDFSVVGDSFDDYLDHLGQYQKAFDELKERLTSAPVIVTPNWSLPFELMCDASGFTIGAVLGKRHNKIMHPIYYASGTINAAQMNYIVSEQEMLAIVSAFEKFRSYLLGAMIVVYTDHATLRTCADNIIRRCIPGSEVLEILQACHDSSVGGHHSGTRTAAKVLECGYHWPTLFHDANLMVRSCDQYQRQGNISRRQGMPMNLVMEIEVFDVLWIDFMGPFVSSSGMKYILVAFDYVSKWVQAVVLPDNEAKSVNGQRVKHYYGCILGDKIVDRYRLKHLGTNPDPEF